MKRWLSLLLCGAILYTVMASTSPAAAQAAPPQIAAKACALIEAGSGRVLYQQNGDAPLPMASTTKVMTALVVLRHARLEDVVTVGRNASGVEGSSMYLDVGEHLTVEQLLLGLLLRSGNDAAVALAEHVSGSVADFVELMNREAAEMGLANTHFVNPHGLPAQNHYASALDLARIMAAAVQTPDFVRIASTRKAQVPWETNQWDRVMQNKNRLLDELEGCIGGKTGFTKEAGRCLVEAVERDGMQLVSVVLSCPDWWNQTTALVEYGFSAYSPHLFVEAGESVHTAQSGGRPQDLPVIAAADLMVPVSQGEELLLRLEIPALPGPPYAEGEKLGEATAIVDGQRMYSVDLIAGAAVEKNGWLDAAGRVFSLWMRGKEG